MLIEGFEEEILTLLHRIKVMKGQDSQVFNRRKNNFVLSHSKRAKKVGVVNELQQIIFNGWKRQRGLGYFFK